MIKTMAETEADNLVTGGIEFEQSAGRCIALLLDLKKNEIGRYNTRVGDKTDLGLYRTLKRIIKEGGI